MSSEAQTPTPPAQSAFFRALNAPRYERQSEIRQYEETSGRALIVGQLVRGEPEEINRLGRTIATWRTQISTWHAARVTNAPTEAANNLIKRVKRAAFGFTNFDNYRIRALLYAGKPDWTLLQTLTPT